MSTGLRPSLPHHARWNKTDSCPSGSSCSWQRPHNLDYRRSGHKDLSGHHGRSGDDCRSSHKHRPSWIRFRFLFWFLLLSDQFCDMLVGLASNSLHNKFSVHISREHSHIGDALDIMFKAVVSHFLEGYRGKRDSPILLVQAAEWDSTRAADQHCTQQSFGFLLLFFHIFFHSHRLIIFQVYFIIGQDKCYNGRVMLPVLKVSSSNHGKETTINMALLP